MRIVLSLGNDASRDQEEAVAEAVLARCAADLQLVVVLGVRRDDIDRPRENRPRGGARRDVARVEIEPVVDGFAPPVARGSVVVGPTYGEATARWLTDYVGWRIVETPRGRRREVHLAEPARVEGARKVAWLLDYGCAVICSVRTARSSRPHGWESAIVDTDAVATVLAREIGADRLVTADELVVSGRRAGPDRPDARTAAGATALPAVGAPGQVG